MSVKSFLSDTITRIPFLSASTVDLLDVRYCDDKIICSDTEAWTYMVVEGENFGVATPGKLESHAADIDRLFETITDVPIHVRLTTMPFDSQAWLQMMLDHHAKEVSITGVQPAPIYQSFMQAQATALRMLGAKTFRRYIGVYLGPIKDKSARRWGSGNPLAIISAKTANPDAPDSKQLKALYKKADSIRSRILSSMRLRARGASANDMWGFYYHCLNLGINQPAPKLRGKTWGSMNASSMAAAIDTHDPEVMKIRMRNRDIVNQKRVWESLPPEERANIPEPSAILESYVVGMSVKLPDRSIPYMWAEQLKELGIPVDISFRFIVKSKQRATDEAQKARRKVDEESEFQASTGNQSDELTHIKQVSEQHSYEVSNDQVPPQIVLTTRVFVHSSSKESALEYSQEAVNIMHDAMQTDLAPLYGSSFDYWKESIPGQKVMGEERTTKHHETYTDIGAITMSGVFTTIEVGHKYGYFIGFYGQTPIFLDPTLLGKQDQAPTIFFNGSLGSGKTVASLQYADLMRIRSYFTVIIDPKHDQLAHLKLHGRGHVRLWSLNKDGKPGMLDPFKLISRDPDPDSVDPVLHTAEGAVAAWKSETIPLVEMAITDMLDSDKPLNHSQLARLRVLISSEANSVNPSMYSLLMRMKEGDLGESAESLLVEEGSLEHNRMRREIKDIYYLLEPQTTDTIGRLIFGKREEDVSLRYKNVNTIIINTNGLELPSDGEKPSNPRERSSAMVYGLLSTYVGNMLIHDKSIKGFKGLIVDEFNVARDNPAFRAVIKRIASMSRSLHITMFLLDQSVASAHDERLFGNKIGGRWVGRSDEKPRRDVAKALGYSPEDHPEEFRALVEAMPAKERDKAGRALISLPPDADTGNNNNIKVFNGEIMWNPEYLAFFSGFDGQNKDERAFQQTFATNADGIWEDPLSPPLSDMVPVSVEEEKADDTETSTGVWV